MMMMSAAPAITDLRQQGSVKVNFKGNCRVPRQVPALYTWLGSRQVLIARLPIHARRSFPLTVITRARPSLLLPNSAPVQKKSCSPETNALVCLFFFPSRPFSAHYTFLLVLYSAWSFTRFSRKKLCLDDQKRVSLGVL